jgi:hypothetical protein
MNHCIIGGVDDEDSGEDGEDEQRGAWMVMAARRHRRRRGGLPRRRPHGGAPPLSTLPSWLHGSPPPWRWDLWGRRKRGSGGCKFVGGGVPHELGFLPLYSLSDSHLPISSRNGAGLSWPSELGIRCILYPEPSPWNSLQLYNLRVLRLTPSSSRNVTIFEKSSGTDFWKVPIWLQQDFHLYSW